MFANEIRRAIEIAQRVRLDAVATLMWRACADKQITDTEAEELALLIEARKAVPPPAKAPRRSTGSRPRSDASVERRRTWAATGRLPPALAARFTQAEVAVLAVVAETVAQEGDCRYCLEMIAALAGVCRTTVKGALREAAAQGLVTIELRRQTAWRNLTNIVRIVSPEWKIWNLLARRTPPGGGGGKFATGTNTLRYNSGEKPESGPGKRLPKGLSKGIEGEPDEKSVVGQDRPDPGDEKPGLAA